MAPQSKTQSGIEFMSRKKATLFMLRAEKDNIRLKARYKQAVNKDRALPCGHCRERQAQNRWRTR
jgi:hypothetical protein